MILRKKILANILAYLSFGKVNFRIKSIRPLFYLIALQPSVAISVFPFEHHE